MASETRSVNHALVAAKNGAECYKVYGDPGKTAAVLSGREQALGVPYAAVYYDAGWRICDAEEAAYMLRLRSVPANERLTHEGCVHEKAEHENVTLKSAAHPILCELTVEKITGEELIGFTVSAGRTRGGE